MLPKPADYYVGKLRELHDRMQTDLLHHLREQEDATPAIGNAGSDENTLAGVADVRGGDTIYTIDAHSEEILFDFCETWSREIGPFVLISEGIEDAGWRAFPDGASVDEGSFLLIIDPIDGTRNIMYDKRSAWSLAALAPQKNSENRLGDICIAAMSELPTAKQWRAEQIQHHKMNASNPYDYRTVEDTEMPRCFSSSIQSDVVARWFLRAVTEPASCTAPPYRSSFSVSVVLPASGWEMMAKVRRRLICSRSIQP